MEKVMRCPDLPDIGEDWIVLEGCRYQKRESCPICWTKVYLNPGYGDVARSIGRTREPLFIQIENRYHERVEEIEQQITAVALPSELSGILQAQPLSPALSTVRRYLGSTRSRFLCYSHHSSRQPLPLRAEAAARSERGY